MTRRADTGPVPFLIVTAARTGSWHLVHLLNQHPRVVCNGEPLNPYDVSWPRDELDTSGLFALGFSGDLGLVPKDQPPAAAGFKVLRETLTPEAFSELVVWPGLRVVILRRENLLESLRSRTQAGISGRWQRVHTEPWEGEQPSVTIDLADCRRYFEGVDAFYDRIRMQTSHLPAVEITYEQLVENESVTVERVCSLVGVDPVVSPEHVLLKQEHRNLQETIVNYHELREAFRETPYAHFF